MLFYSQLRGEDAIRVRSGAEFSGVAGPRLPEALQTILVAPGCELFLDAVPEDGFTVRGRRRGVPRGWGRCRGRRRRRGRQTDVLQVELLRVGQPDEVDHGLPVGGGERRRQLDGVQPARHPSVRAATPHYGS